MEDVLVRASTPGSPWTRKSTYSKTTSSAFGDGVPVCFVKNSTNGGYFSFTQVWKKNVLQTVTHSTEMGMSVHYEGFAPTLKRYHLVGLDPQRTWVGHLTKLLDGKNVKINPQCGLMIPIICESLIGLGISQPLEGDVHRSLAVRLSSFSMAYLEINFYEVTLETDKIGTGSRFRTSVSACIKAHFISWSG